MLQQSSPSLKPKKPGHKFFVIAILAGMAALLFIWLKERPSRPLKKSEPLEQPEAKRTNRAVAPVPVLVKNKSNSPAALPTNVISILTSNVHAAVPPASAKTNIFSDDAFAPRSVRSVLEAQVALTRIGISPGSIDGAIGSQTRAALRAFQQKENLPITDELDAPTRAKLLLVSPLYTDLVVTTNDLARLQPLGAGWLSKSQQTQLEYETILELLAEKSHSHPGFIKLINPGINWSNVVEGIAVRAPNIEAAAKTKARAAFIRIRLAEKTLQAFDDQTNLLAHFPCSVAQRIEKRPVGELRVEKLAPNPDYTFDPENFPESAEARQIKTKLILPPGPNNPVGTIWIGLDKPGYGIHGTPKPEEVGRTESHGCFRLANWNAEYLLNLVTIGTPVLIDP